MVNSSVYPKLERVPGKQNWVDYAGGLPDYIERIAKHLHYEKGMTIGEAIATARNTVKRWMALGKVAKYGSKQHVTAKTAALAAAADAEWNAKRIKGRLAMAARRAIDNSDVTDEFALELAEELLNEDGDLVIDLADANIDSGDTMVCLMVPPKVAKKVAIDGGVPPEDLHLTLTFHGSTTPQQYQQICKDLAAWAADGGPGELKGGIGGLGQFPPGPDGVPHYAPADVPGLNQLHENVKAVTSKSVPASADHGFTPHMTLGYTQPGEEPPAPVPPTPVKFSEMHVVRGNNQRTSIPLQNDTRGAAGTGAPLKSRGRIRAGDVQLAEGSVDISALAERANRISDPDARATARAKVIELAVSPTAAQRKKYGDAQGKFPIWNRDSLHSAIMLARTPAQRRRIIRVARKLGYASMIPSTWNLSLSELAMEGILDLASTIPPRNAKGRVSDGRRSYKSQGKWKHGFVPVDTPAVESKAKGSPIAEKRIHRLFGAATSDAHSPSGAYLKAPTGRAGQRTAKNKSNPASVNVDEKSFPGSEAANNLGDIRNSPFNNAQNKNQVKGGSQRVLPTTQKEAGKSTRVPQRARQDWDQIPANLKTVRNGTRYVYAQFGGKGYITPWVGGVQTVSGSSLDQRKVYATLSTITANAMTGAQLRDVISNPKSPDSVKTTARLVLKQKAAAKNKASGKVPVQ